jgi:hypothetical protein
MTKKELGKLTYRELRALAREHKVLNYSRLNKDELIKEVFEAYRTLAAASVKAKAAKKKPAAKKAPKKAPAKKKTEAAKDPVKPEFKRKSPRRFNPMSFRRN